MKKVKFTFNSFLVLVIIFSAFIFFFLVGLSDMAGMRINNEVYEVEGTDYSVRYTELKPSGIYKGKDSSGVLVVEGNFGYDWGISLEGDTIFCNEYRKTTLGLMTCDFVKIDTVTKEKSVILKDCVMIGKCASGEIVCLDGFMMPSWNYAKNPLYKIYSMSSPKIRAEKDEATVRYIDPATGETVYSFCGAMSGDDTLEQYRSLDLKEVGK